MIGYLSGELLEVDGKDLLVGVGGVGYRVRVTNSEDSRIKNQESRKVELYVHTYVKEDEITLYGFVEKAELKMFELLIGVSGVGPKMAMGVLSHGRAEQIQRGVAMADVSFFTKVSGIGKKNAQRIIVDLKSKLGDLEDLDLGDEGGEDEVTAALTQLGFARKEVGKVLKTLEVDLSEEDKIKEAIRRLGKK